MDELLDNAPCGFLVFTDDGKIVEANATLLDLLGYERGEILALHVEKILSVAGHIFYQTHFFPLLKLKNQIEEVYLSLRSKSGSDTPVLVNAVRREHRDGRFFNDCVFMPMRQRNQYEDEILKAKREAEEAMRAKDEFLSVVSHELRTPLNGILGWAQILQTRQLDSETIKRAIDAIVRGAKSQSKLIEDILDFTRIISGKLRLDVRQVDLIMIIESAIDIIAPAASAKDIRLQKILDSNSYVSGDAERLQQILWNLLSNAVKFTPKGGRVQIRVQRVNSSVEIIISDTGRGISAEFLPYVFERFKQSDNSTTRRHGGLGLGMAITRHMVELHGGTIRAESAGEDLGATFTVSLPVSIVVNAKPSSDEKELEPISPIDENSSPDVLVPRLDGLRILIVDDEADARDLLIAVLSGQGADVAAAATVAEAVREFQTTPPELIVSDIEMPDEDGFSLIKQLRAFNQTQTKKIPAIALTAHARPSERLKILAAGYQMHLAKPVDTSELIAVIANFADLNK
ncbi:MAG TPA: ATP-binding protein [Pyrinomonadaceae bacterium]|jgi:PAS domain S-box-containing protein